jgi:DNA polymerase elongation subunit (family B)
MAKRFGPDAVREGDVDPIRRWIADNPRIEIETEPRVLYLDLEAQEPEKSIDDARDGNVAILTWVAIGSDGETYKGWTSAGEWLIDDYDHPDDFFQALTDEDERPSLATLVTIMRRYDAIVAWFGGDERRGDSKRGRGFDFDALRNRCDNIGVAPNGTVAEPMPTDPGTWDRWIWVDQLEVHRKYAQGDGAEKASLALGHVATSLGISDGKIDLPGDKIFDTWYEDPERVLEYNTRDTELLVEIEEKTGYLALHFQVCALCNQIPHSSSLAATAQGDGYLLRFAGQRDYRWPTVSRGNLDEAKAPGAYVFPPREQGALHDIAVADFSALYPSIMRTLNIGPDTVVASPDDVPSSVPLARAPTHLVGNNPSVWFRQDRASHFVAALETMISNRAQFQAERDKYQPGTPEYRRYSALDSAAKIVANSFYGILLAKSWRYYDRLAGTAVTQTGQWLIKQVSQSARQHGYTVVGGDTDSVFVHAGGPLVTPRGEVEMLTPLGRKFQAWCRGVNDSWADKFAEMGARKHYIDLDWEKVFARMLIPLGADGKPVKKMYAGALSMHKGQRPKKPWKHEIKGIAIQRGDRQKLARDMQQELIDRLIGKETDPELPVLPQPDELKAWIADWESRITNGDLDLADVVTRKSLRFGLAEYRRTNFTTAYCKACRHDIPEGIDKTGPERCPQCSSPRTRCKPAVHARVAEELVKQGKRPLKGDKIPYVLVHRDGKSFAVHTDDPHCIRDLDRGYYWRGAYAQSYVFLISVYPDEVWEKPHTAERRIQRALKEREAERTVMDTGLFGMLAGRVVTLEGAPGIDVVRETLAGYPGNDTVVVHGHEVSCDADLMVSDPHIIPLDDTGDLYGWR